jgi:DNA-binding beta-propeller fold protein YncE
MCSRFADPWRFALSVALLLTTASFGCARPKGILFERIDPPRVWPPPPEQPRIRLLGMISGSEDLKAAQSGREVLAGVLRGPRPPIKFSGPHSVAVREPNVLAVADTKLAAAHVIDLDQRTHLLVHGWDEERLASPVGVTWVGQRLFVTDAKRHEVIELDDQGRFRHRFGADVLVRPVGIGYAPKREQLYVVDGGAHQLRVFDLDGRGIGTIGGPGSEPGTFNYPTYLCVHGDRLLVADSGNSRVQLLDLDGACISVFGQKGDGAGDFSLPKGVAFDSDGHIYVVDAHFENVQIFNTEGQLLLAFGQEGRELGRFWLPAGLAIDSKDRIWVADSGNRRLQVFEYIRSAS